MSFFISPIPPQSQYFVDIAISIFYFIRFQYYCAFLPDCFLSPSLYISQIPATGGRAWGATWSLRPPGPSRQWLWTWTPSATCTRTTWCLPKGSPSPHAPRGDYSKVSSGQWPYQSWPIPKFLPNTNTNTLGEPLNNTNTNTNTSKCLLAIPIPILGKVS